MASFKKNKSGKWEFQIAKTPPGGKIVRRGKTFDTKAEGLMWAAKTEAEIMGGKKGAVDKTFGDLLIKYQKEVVPNKGSYEIESRRVDFILKNEIASVRLRDLDVTHFIKFRNARMKQVSSGTVIRDMASMGVALGLAVKEWKWMDHNPIKDVTRPAPPPSRDRRITDDEIDRIIFASGYDYNDKPVTVAERTGAAFLFAIETGMRDGELASLTIDRVHFDKKYAHIRAQDSKGRSKRDVPLSAEAIRIIRQMDVTEGRVFGLTSIQISAAFGRIRNGCMIQDLHFHDTRHEAITRLAAKLDVLELARTVGHKNLNQLLTYYNMTASQLAEKL